MTDEKKEQKVKEEEAPPFKFDNKMAQKPIIAPDGHVVLSQEDIDGRD
jgi:hypothetical protein